MKYFLLLHQNFDHIWSFLAFRKKKEAKTKFPETIGEKNWRHFHAMAQFPK